MPVYSSINIYDDQTHKLNKTSTTSEIWKIGITAKDYITAKFYNDDIEVAPLSDDVVFIYG